MWALVIEFSSKTGSPNIINFMDEYFCTHFFIKLKHLSTNLFLEIPSEALKRFNEVLMA